LEPVTQQSQEVNDEETSLELDEVGVGHGVLLLICPF